MARFEIFEGHMSDLQRKLKYIKSKCEKFGCSFTFETVGEKMKEVTTKFGERFSAKFIIVDVEGTAIINDWEFIATVEHTNKGNIFSKAMIDVEIPERYRTTKSVCEHCNSNRERKNTCIIRNIKTGEFKQVGNSCLNDFTHGMSASFVTRLASIKPLFDEMEKEGRAGDFYFPANEKLYKTTEVLQCCAETIRHFGYMQGSESESTKFRMQEFFDYLHRNTKFWGVSRQREVKQLIDKVGFNPESPEAIQMTKDAVAWLDEQESYNDYMHNLKTVMSLEYVTVGRFGLILSLFPTWNRNLEMKVEHESEQQSEHIGQIGDRIEITVKSVKCISSWIAFYKGNQVMTYVWKIVDVDGNVYTWKTSTYLNTDVPPVKMKGTVKEHKDFRGIKQTNLTRCVITEKRP